MKIKYYRYFGKVYVLLLVMALIIPFYSVYLISSVKAQPTRTDISVHIAYEMITNSTQYPNLTILDVRTQGEYDTNHLYGATLIPLDELINRIDELEPYNNTEIIVYCRTGSRSLQASQILVNENFTKIFNMLGGIEAWITAGYDYWPDSNQQSIPFTWLQFLIGLSVVICIIIFAIKKKGKNKIFYNS